MDYNINEETIKKLKQDRHWQEFLEYAVLKIDELDSVSGLDKLDNEQAGQTAKVRQLSLEKVAEIFSPFFKYTQKKERTAEEVNKVKDKYGL